MKTVSEVSRLTGISIRALHHYDTIGLLPPSAITEAGYRLYDEAALKRLQTIMLFRELEMPLAEIKALLDSPSFDEKSAMKDQVKLLKLKAARLIRLIEHTEKLMKGEGNMDFSAFDGSDIKSYAKEAKERWGATDAYREFEKKDGARNEAERTDAAEGLMSIFDRFGELLRLDESESGDNARAAVKALQSYISANYYNCTSEILAGLGETYVQDERFKANIDARCGDGTAEFASAAIRAYLEK